MSMLMFIAKMFIIFLLIHSICFYPCRDVEIKIDPLKETLPTPDVGYYVICI